MINTSVCFGITSGAGIYGTMADAGVDIICTTGISPLSKWVNDHIFFRIRCGHLSLYNTNQKKWRNSIAANGGRIHTGGRYWYRGDIMLNGWSEEYDKDASTILQDLSGTSPRLREDEDFTYCISDIDRITDPLGIPWELLKDIPFLSKVPFIGLEWQLDKRTVAILDKKKA